MDTRQYLSRINYTGRLEPGPGVLSTLQESHLLAVPFENLDIHAGKAIVLELPLIFRKVITMKRGGFCYELNGLFHWLLQQLGFKVTMASGRVYDVNRKDFGPEFDHMLIIADVAGQEWIVDVGFGEFAMYPIPFVLNRPHDDVTGRFVVEKDTGEYFRVSKFSEKEGRYIPEYTFSRKERQFVDFSGMCTYHQTSPESHFTRHKVCSIATSTGRITLTDDKLIVRENGVRTETPVSTGEEFERVLKGYFDMSVPIPGTG